MAKILNTMPTYSRLKGVITYEPSCQLKPLIEWVDGECAWLENGEV